jgi:hypothetical protein
MRALTCILALSAALAACDSTSDEERDPPGKPAGAVARDTAPAATAADTIVRITSADTLSALEVLSAYLENGRAGDYATMAALYGGARDSLPLQFVEARDTISVEGFFREVCTAGQLLCRLGLLRVLNARPVPPDTLRFRVELADSAGTRFVMGPCCGEEEGDTVTSFVYDVLKTRDGFRVLTLPVYVP